MWEPFRLSMEEWAPGCRIVYDKFHIIQHANDAVDEVRRAEFFRKGRKMRDVIKGKKWLLLSRWKNLVPRQRGVLNRLFQLNRRVFKAYMLKESLERLWDYRYEGAMVNYLGKWMDQLRWQRLPSFQKLAAMLIKHLDGILNYCRTKVRFGVVEAVNGNIRMLINRGRGYKNLSLPAPESEAHGRHQHRIRRFSENQESRVECNVLRIPLKSALSAFSAKPSSTFVSLHRTRCSITRKASDASTGWWIEPATWAFNRSSL